MFRRFQWRAVSQRLPAAGRSLEHTHGFSTKTGLGAARNRLAPMAWRLAAFSVAVAVLASAQPAEAAGLFSSQPDYAKLRKDFEKAMEEEDEKRGDGTSIGPTMIRLAWHSSGTYSKFDHTGGSNGATMRYSPEKDWGANAGLDIARSFVEKVKSKHPAISYADAYTLAGVVAVEYMGGPKINWRPGRTDSSKPTSVPDGRLPDADKGVPAATNSHIRDIFCRMGFNDQEIVALSGAHALGRCHTNASGYWGPWTYAESTFSNEYFRLLLEEKWTVKKTHEGKPWKGPLQYENPDGALMMLPSDMALLEDHKFRTYVELYAKDADRFSKDFATAFSKLLELGVKFQ